MMTTNFYGDKAAGSGIEAGMLDFCHLMTGDGDGAEAAATPLAIAPHPAAARRIARVLHVDGDFDTALMLATLLMPEIQVTHVYTLEAALRAVAAASFDMVVMDPDLPDGDGVALAAALRDGSAITPLLLYAAQHTAWRDQASAFLLKPWTSPRQLWSAVSRLIGLANAPTLNP